MKAKNSAGQVNKRRQKALLRLEEQLSLGVKQPKGTFLILDMVPLDEKDVKRIKIEMSTLHSKIMTDESARAVRTKRKR